MNQKFYRPADVLPGWMGASHHSVIAQVRPVDGPITGTQQPARKNTARSILQGHAAFHGEKSPLNPAVDLFSRHVNQPASSGLTADFEKSNLEFSFNHDDIVANTSTNMQQEKKIPKRPKEVDDFIWGQIEAELTRRRLNVGWLWRKLDSSRQVVNGWKNGRGVPTNRYDEIAELFGWSIERLTTGQYPAPRQQSLSVAPPVQPAPLVRSPEASASYSPMALDLAGMFDAIPDAQQKRRAYALMVQMIVMSAPSSLDTGAPGVPQTPALHQHQ